MVEKRLGPSTVRREPVALASDPQLPPLAEPFSLPPHVLAQANAMELLGAERWHGALDQPVSYPPNVLAHQDGPKLLQHRRGVVERPDDRLAVADREREHLDHPPERVLETVGQVGVVHQSGELQHELIADWETGEVHPSDPDRTYVRLQPRDENAPPPNGEGRRSLSRAPREREVGRLAVAGCGPAAVPPGVESSFGGLVQTPAIRFGGAAWVTSGHRSNNEKGPLCGPFPVAGAGFEPATSGL